MLEISFFLTGDPLSPVVFPNMAKFGWCWCPRFSKLSLWRTLRISWIRCVPWQVLKGPKVVKEHRLRWRKLPCLMDPRWKCIAICDDPTLGLPYVQRNSLSHWLCLFSCIRAGTKVWWKNYESESACIHPKFRNSGLNQAGQWRHIFQAKPAVAWRCVACEASQSNPGWLARPRSLKSFYDILCLYHISSYVCTLFLHNY